MQVTPIGFRNNQSEVILKDLKLKGIVYIENIPTDWDFLSFIENLGRVFTQYEGKKLWDVKAKKDSLKASTSVGSAAIGFHSELYEFETSPPRYVALRCIRNSEEGGNLYLLNILDFLNQQKAELISKLESEKVTFFTKKSIESGGYTVKTPIGINSKKEKYLRYSEQFFVDSKIPEFVEMVDLIKSYGVKEKITIKQSDNSLILWDNFKFLHARSSFKDLNRHLQRICFNTI